MNPREITRRLWQERGGPEKTDAAYNDPALTQHLRSIPERALTREDVVSEDPALHTAITAELAMLRELLKASP